MALCADVCDIELLKKAEWIAIKKNAKKSVVTFQKNFTVKKNIKKAELILSTSCFYKVYMNKVSISEELFTSGSCVEGLKALKYDITAFMKASQKNTLSIVAAKNWFASPNNSNDLFSGAYAVIAVLVLCYENEEVQYIQSDSSWGVTGSFIVSSGFCDGETIDYRQLEYYFSVDDCVEAEKPLIKSYSKDFIISHTQYEIKESEHIKVKSIMELPDHRYLLDFGINVIGYVAVTLSGGQGDKIRLRHLYPEEYMPMDKNKIPKQQTTFFLNGTPMQRCSPKFTCFAFRYVIIEEYFTKPEKNDFEAVCVNMPKAGNIDMISACTLPNDLISKSQTQYLEFIRYFDCCTVDSVCKNFYCDVLKSFMLQKDLESSAFYQEKLESIFTSQHIKDNLFKDEISYLAAIIISNCFDFQHDKEFLLKYYETIVYGIRNYSIKSIRKNKGFKLNWFNISKSDTNHSIDENIEKCMQDAVYANAAYVGYKIADVCGKQDDMMLFSRLYLQLKDTFNKVINSGSNNYLSIALGGCLNVISNSVSDVKIKEIEDFLENNENHYCNATEKFIAVVALMKYNRLQDKRPCYLMDCNETGSYKKVPYPDNVDTFYSSLGFVSDVYIDFDFLINKYIKILYMSALFRVDYNYSDHCYCIKVNYNQIADDKVIVKSYGDEKFIYGLVKRDGKSMIYVLVPKNCNIKVEINNITKPLMYGENFISIFE